MSSSAAAKLSPKIILGLILLLLSSYLLARLFRDPLRHELNYVVSAISGTPDSLTPPNTDFALVIDKIAAASAIIQNVDPLNSRTYQLALKDGIAHATGTSVPGQEGNIFLFAHSSADLLTAERYNSVFYLMHHLGAGDIIKIWYLGVEHDYTVSEKKIVAASDSQYLTKKTTEEQLTLMTCWPPGTTLRRLIIIAKPVQNL